MPKYGKFKASWAEDENHYDPPMLVNLTVFDNDPVWTGLYDKDGDPLYHFPNPIGFEKELWD